MPPGLLPVGNAVSVGGNSGAAMSHGGIPKP
jgi:protein phosphatase methylesterase 1